MNKATICRVCLNHEENLYQLREFTDQFYQVTGIRVRYDALLCPTCIGRLHEAFAFREQAIYADKTYKNMSIDDDEEDEKEEFPRFAEEEEIEVKPKLKSARKTELELDFIKQEPIVEIDLAPTADFDLGPEDEDNEFYFKSENDFYSGFDSEEEVKPKRKTRAKRKRKGVRPVEADEFRINGCPYCFYNSSDSTELSQHVENHLEENGGVDCDHCGKKFRNKKYIRKHLNRVFGIGVQFKDKPPIKRRRKNRDPSSRSCSDDPVTCDICGKLCKNKYLLKSHIKIHEEREKYECPLCFKQFLVLATYLEHEKLHALGKQYECNICGKKFGSKAGLKGHEVDHSEQPKLTCHMCGKFFRNKMLLKAHMITHSDAPQFVCPHCGKDYKQKSSLREHMFTHTGKRTFSCQLCTTTFGANRSLTRHLKKAHNIIR